MKRQYIPMTCVLTALVLRIVVLSFFQDSVLYQPAEGSHHDRSIYIAAAEAASNGSFFPDGALDFLPLYPWLLGIIGMIFGTGPITAAVLGIACDLSTVFLIVLFARKLGATNRIAAIAGLLYAAYPLAAIYSLLAMPNTLNTLGVTAFAYAAYSLLEGRERPASLFSFLLLGLLAGVLTLGFAGMILITLSIAVFTLIKTRSWVSSILIIAGMALPLAPAAVHNTRAEGSFVLLTTHGGFNFYMGNHERATGYPLKVLNFRMTAKEMLEDAHRHAEEETGKTLTRAESSAWWNDQAKFFWKQHPADAALLTVKKFILFWNHRDMDDLRILEQLRVTDSFFRKLIGSPFALFGILGLIGIVFAKGATVPRITLLAGMTGIVLFFITARYRLTFVPLMAILGAAGLAQLTGAWSAGSKTRMLSMIPIAFLVLLPLGVKDQRPVDYYNAAIQLAAEQQLDEAIEIVNRGLEIDPNFGSLHFARGNILFAKGDFTGAVASLKTARALDPGNPTIAFNLALSLARSGDYCGARDVLSEMQKPLEEKASALLKRLSEACGQQL